MGIANSFGSHRSCTAAKYYKEYAFHASRETEIKLATLGNSAGMYGGVKMVIG